jgi:hypothetical protein
VDRVDALAATALLEADHLALVLRYGGQNVYRELIGVWVIDGAQLSRGRPHRFENLQIGLSGGRPLMFSFRSVIKNAVLSRGTGRGCVPTIEAGMRADN